MYPPIFTQERTLTSGPQKVSRSRQFTILGDPAIWTAITNGGPTLALLSSSRVPASILLQVHDWARHWRQHGPIIVSGFQSETENEALQVLLGGMQPVVLVLARSMLKRLPPEYRRPVTEGRLLLISPFADSVKWISAERARERNRIVCALADEILIAHAEPGSKTAQVSTEIASWGKPLWTVEHPSNRDLHLLGFRAYPNG